MNNQELPTPHFDDPLSDPGSVNPNQGRPGPRITRPLRTSPRQHSSWRTIYLQPMSRLPPRWRKPKFWGMAGVLALCLLLLFFATHSAAPPGPRQTAPDTMVFFTGNQPTLVFAHSIGTVHIHSGTDGQVSIKENRNGFPDAIHIHYAQDGDTIRITSDVESDLSSDTWVDFDVSVPRQASLSASLPDGGTLEADSLGGQIALSNTNGSIWATNDTGALTMQTQSGSITVMHCSAQMKLTTQNGTITTSDGQMSGHSLVQAETGTINFHGVLERSASAFFKNSNGQVSLNLPRGSAFHVQVRTRGGSVNSDFPGITIRPRQGGTEADGNVGAPPRAQLTIQTTSGPVLLNQGS